MIINDKCSYCQKTIIEKDVDPEYLFCPYCATSLYYDSVERFEALHNKKQNNEIAIIWRVEDVQAVRPDLTDEQAMAVLLNVKKNHDANDGVTWETLEAAADFLFSKKKKNITRR